MKTSPLKVKISYNDEIHAIPFNLSFEELQEKIKNIYKNKLPPKFKIFYIDIEGDIISISCQEDLDEAKEIFGKENFPFKLMIDLNTDSVRESIKIDENNKANVQSSYLKNEKDSYVKIESNSDLMVENNEAKKSINSLYEMEDENNINKNSKNITQENFKDNQKQEMNNSSLLNNSSNEIICQKCRGTGKDNRNQLCAICLGRGKNSIQYQNTSLESNCIQNSASSNPANIFVCKLCNNQINGIRYKCVICKSLDICEKCESTFGHPHALLKIRNPSMDPKIILVVPKEEIDNEPFIKLPNYQLQNINSPPIFYEMKKYEIQILKESPSNPFKLLPQQMFSKTFTIKNSGKIAWPVSTKMQVLGGDNLSGKEIHIGSLHPGQEIDITQMLKSPNVPGKYNQTFQIIYTDQNRNIFGFGPIFKIEIIVGKDVKANPGNVPPNMPNLIDIPLEFQENAKKLILLGITDKEFIISALTQTKNDFQQVAELIFSNANPYKK